MQPDPQFYLQDATEVATQLIGMLLVSNRGGKRVSGKIVETEAYLGQLDAASHAFGGKTARNEVMFGPPGRIYVYFTYGMHYCMNIVTAPSGVAQAVLLRALEPIEGIDIMRERRGVDRITNLCSGPAKLVQALGISKSDNGIEVGETAGIWLEDTGDRLAISSGPRIGISRAADLPLRFWATSSPFISQPPKRALQ